MPGARIISTVQEKDVAMLENADVQFVSLVRHGANRQPFRVIKEEKGGGADMSRIIQSIVTPKGAKLGEISGATGLGWLSDANTDTCKSFSDYDKFTQVEEDKFVPGTLSMEKVHDSGVWAVTGQLIKAADKADSVISLGEMQEKLMSIPSTAMDTPVAEIHRPNYVITFGEMFYKELDSLLDIVRGVMSQSGLEPKKRKSTVMGAVDAFKTFLSVGLDTTAEFKKADQSFSDVGKKYTTGGIEDMFKTKEEFSVAVTDIVSSILKAQADDTQKTIKTVAADAATAAVKSFSDANPVVKDATVPADKDEKAVADAAALAANAEKAGTIDLTTVTNQLAGLVESVKTLTEKSDTMGEQLATSPAGEDALSTEGLVPKAKEEKPSVFGGMLGKSFS